MRRRGFKSRAKYAAVMVEEASLEPAAERTNINFRLAFEAMLKEAEQQEATLDDLRARSIGVLSAVVIATSIFAAVSNRSDLTRIVSAVSVLLFMFGVFKFFQLLFPKYEWGFVQDPVSLLDIHKGTENGLSEDEFYNNVVRESAPEAARNSEQLVALQKLFRQGLRAFLFELVIWSLVVALH